MANFPTHAGTSLVLGGALGTAAHIGYGVPLPSCLLAGGLCTIAGLLPDVDSDNAIIFREVLTFTAAVTPMLLLDHFRSNGWDQETIVVASGLVYVIIRFGLGEVIRRTTVHRGMWHSIPAAAIVSIAVYFLCACPELNMRLFKTAAAGIGYLWHLILDEIYAVETGMLRVRKKKSFGTAFKFVGKNFVGNAMAYGLLIAVASAAVMYPKSSRLAHDHSPTNVNGANGIYAPESQTTPVPTNPQSQTVPTANQYPYPALPGGAQTPYQSPPVYQPPQQQPVQPRQPFDWNR